MAEQYANCTVHHKMHSDRRFDLLGELGGWTRNDASFRMVQLWARCTAMQTDRPPAIEIRAHLGLRGEELLLTSGLGERCPDGSIRVLGGGLTGGDVDRFSWYEPLEARNAAGGLARAEQVRRTGRGPRGRFAPAGSSDHQQPDQRVTSGTSDRPAIRGAPPASGFRIPEEEDSLPPARDPAVPQPEPKPVPAVSPPAPAREDIARTQPFAGDQFEASKSTVPSQISRTWTDRKPITDRDAKPAIAIRPSSETTLGASPPPAPILPDAIARAEARRRLIGEAWQLGGDAFRELGREGIEPTAYDPWTGMPGAGDEGMKLLIAHVDRLLVGDPPDIHRARAVFQRRIAVAKAEGRAASPPTRRWLTPMRIWDPVSFAKGAEMSPEQVRPRPAPSQRAGPAPAPPRPRDRDPPPAPIPRDQLAGPEQFAEARKLLAAVTSNDDDTPTDKQHRRRKAAT